MPLILKLHTDDMQDIKKYLVAVPDREAIYRDKSLDFGARMSLNPSSATYVCDLVQVIASLCLSFLIWKMEMSIESGHWVLTWLSWVGVCKSLSTGTEVSIG